MEPCNDVRVSISQLALDWTGPCEDAFPIRLDRLSLATSLDRSGAIRDQCVPGNPSDHIPFDISIVQVIAFQFKIKSIRLPFSSCSSFKN